MKIGFILTTYDRIDDFLAHLDILKYFPLKHEVIPIWMKKDSPDRLLEEMKSYPHAHYIDGISFRIGPLLGLVAGLRKAHQIGLDYIVYRNGDDWLFNQDFCVDNFNEMNNGKDIAAYNWLTANSLSEFALNEMYLRVDKFMATVDEAENYFKNSTKKCLCEMKMARWVKRTIGYDCKTLYKLPDREIWPGVGYEKETLPEVFASMNKEMPKGYLESLVDNSRFFNRKWQLIGSHNNYQRFNFYSSIRKDIPYAEKLEGEKHFKRWLECVTTAKEWNLPSTPTYDDYTKQLMRSRQKTVPMIIRPMPKKMPMTLLRPSLGRNQ